LAGEFIAGIELQRVPEFGSRRDLVFRLHGLVAALQGLHHQLLTGKLAGGYAFHVTRV
jgi:hypothetical protein